MKLQNRRQGEVPPEKELFTFQSGNRCIFNNVLLSSDCYINFLSINSFHLPSSSQFVFSAWGGIRDKDLTSSGDCFCSKLVKHDARICYNTIFTLFILGSLFSSRIQQKGQKGMKLNFRKSNCLPYHDCAGLRVSKSLTGK